MGIIENRDAQFMLLAGFIVAIGLVITTVMLNNIIFESNMAGEAGSDPLKYDIANLMAISANEMRSAYRNATALGGTDERKINDFINQTKNFRSNLSKIYALHGEGVNVSWENWTNKGYADFTENGTASGAANWTVIESVSNSNITVNVTTGTFSINITNTTSSWEISLPAGYSSFNSTNISSHVPSPYSIMFQNGANAAGNYSINGTASGRAFTRARDYILNATVTFYTSRMRADITIPVSVPW